MWRSDDLWWCWTNSTTQKCNIIVAFASPEFCCKGRMEVNVLLTCLHIHYPRKKIVQKLFSENIAPMSFPGEMIRSPKVGSMLGHRLRRWPNIEPIKAVHEVSCLLGLNQWVSGVVGCERLYATSCTRYDVTTRLWACYELVVFEG